MSPQDELTKVQNLYLMQMDVWKVLDGRIRSPQKVEEARKCIRQFKKLLKEVDWKYMGGEDVYNELRQMADEADMELKKIIKRREERKN
ncbi:MAG: hypothetical protein QF741_01310 [Candidatus Peribacteraceae bacterium]|jgi:membrane-associated HD superfamily phosphohydrolase|nr:hypothetical protein [Candidatus Peribacteraceae bacterium]MDP7453975.1 hypothetical protein [Candidatus Peribacteraceae bacterium]MDP7645622.1 hypothetical protein [Candidatus Peribacteraceae bacterium]|tara:strand:- start:245 stop:511 length:267 start_codon:yes stop_codon:yes gene_type:complete